jgi:hypothetical protein
VVNLNYLPLPPILKENNFIIPSIELYEDDSIKIYETEQFFKKEGRRIKYTGLRVKYNGKWDEFMTYREDHKEGMEHYSLYDQAYGDVITTGLGFGVTENWLSKKESVKSLKVLELSENLIKYHKANTKFNTNVELIHADANTYKGKCDVLILDHYELPRKAVFAKIDEFMRISENISCNTVWAWRLEDAIDSYEDYKAVRRVWDKLPDINKEKFELYKRLYRGYY